MMSVDQPQRLEAVLEPVVDGPPIDTGGLHHYQLHLALSQPLTKVPHPFRRRRERGLVHLPRGAIEQLHARNDRIPVHIETSHPTTVPSHRISSDEHASELTSLMPKSY